MCNNCTSLTDLAGTRAAPGAPYLDFGARLYSPGTATWLSVDPMAEKYYGIGPLTYCAANPVNLVDPTGRKLVVRDSSEGLATEYEWQEVGETWGFYDVDGKAYSGSNEYILSLTDALSTLMEGKAGSDLIQEIVGYKDDKVYIGENANPRNKGKNNYYPNTKTVAWNSKNSKIDSPFLSLGHELAHALSDLRGNRNSDLWIPKGEEGGFVLSKDVMYDEIFASHIENQLRAEHGMPLRTTYLSGERSSYLIWSTIVDSKGRSMYFDKQGSTTYKWLPPSQRYEY